DRGYAEKFSHRRHVCVGRSASTPGVRPERSFCGARTPARSLVTAAARAQDNEHWIEVLKAMNQNHGHDAGKRMATVMSIALPLLLFNSAGHAADLTTV